MQNRLKRISAFLCAFTLLVTTVLGSSVMMLVKAAAPQEPTPVTLDGFTDLTIKDFVDSNGTQMPTGRYEGSKYGNLNDYYVDGLTNFDKKLLSMKIKFEGGEFKHSLVVGGVGEWSGFNLHPNEDGSAIYIDSSWADNIVDKSIYQIPAVNAGVAGVSSFIGKEFLLQISFEYGEVVGGKADLTMGVYINGALYNNAAFVIPGCNVSAMGSHLALYRQVDNSGIILDNVIIEEEPDTPVEIVPVELEGFGNLTIQDFVDVNGTQMPIGRYEGNNNGNLNDYYVDGLSNFNKKLLSMKIKFEGGEFKHSLVVGGVGEWSGFNLHPNEDGSAIYIDSSWADNIVDKSIYQIPAVNAGVAGVSSFIGKEFLLQISFEYGEVVGGKADLTMGVYINGVLYNDAAFVIPGCNVSAMGSHLALYRQVDNSGIILDNVIIEEEPDTPAEIVPVELEGFGNLTIQDFVDVNGTQMPIGRYEGNNNGNLNDYYVDGLTNFNKKLLSMKIKFEGGEFKHSLVVGGVGEWSGFNLHPNEDGSAIYIDSSWADNIVDKSTYQIPAVNAGVAGVSSFIGKEFLLQISFEYGEVVGGKADLTMGVYINGVLYNDAAFVIPGCNVSAMGSHLALYRQVDNSGIILDNVIIEEEPDTPDTPAEIVPVELEGFGNLTIQDFVDVNGTQMPTGRYEGSSNGNLNDYYVDGLSNFNKKLLSMKIKFEGGEFKHSLVVGGVGEWSGFNLHPNEDGSAIYIDSSWAGSIINTATYQMPVVYAVDAGMNSFIGKEFLLQLSFEYGEVVGGKADLTMGVYINGVLYNDAAFVIPGCNVSAMGSHLALYRQVDNSGIILDNVIIEEEPDTPDTPAEIVPVELEGFGNLTIQDFVDVNGTQMPTGRYEGNNNGNLNDYYVDGLSNFDKKLLSMKIKFEGGEFKHSLVVGGVGEWSGFNLHPNEDGSAIYIDSSWAGSIINTATYQMPVVYAVDAGMNSFIGEEFLLQLSFEYGEVVSGRADLTLGVYINGALYNNAAFVIPGCNVSAMGSHLALYRQVDNSGIILDNVILEEESDTPDTPDEPEPPIESQKPSEDLEKITFSQYGIVDGEYEYNGDLVVQGVLKDKTSIAGTVLCGDIELSGNGYFHVILGGGNNPWDGIRFITDNTNAMQVWWYEGTNGQHCASFNAADAGVNFHNEKFNLMISTELEGNDIKLGVWFNGILYNNEYITITDKGDKLANKFAAYCNGEDVSVILNSIPELVPEPAPPKKPNESFEKITFEYFGLKDGIYKFDGTGNPIFEGKGAKTLDQKVLCGDVLFSGEGYNHLMVGGGGNVWYGLRFITQANGTIELYWIDEDDMILIDIFNKTVAGATLIDEWLNLMISTEIIDADKDGEKDDIELGVWFNGVLYKEEFYTIIDKASGLGKQLGLFCSTEENSIAIRSIPEYMKGFDYSVYGLTKDWETTVMTAHKAEIASGGSRDAEPFTGDLLKVGTVCLFSVVALVAGVYMVLQRKKRIID